MNEGLVYVGLFTFTVGLAYAILLVRNLFHKESNDVRLIDFILAITCTVFGAALLMNDPGYFIDWMGIAH